MQIVSKNSRQRAKNDLPALHVRPPVPGIFPLLTYNTLFCSVLLCGGTNFSKHEGPDSERVYVGVSIDTPHKF